MKEKKKKHFFVGGPVSQNSEQERELAKRRLSLVQNFIREQGYSCYCTIPGNPDLEFDAKGRPVIAEKYVKKAEKRVLDTIRSFRAGDIKYSVAYHYWTIDELRKADACVWVLSRSSTGSGAEIAWMLKEYKHCLIFFEESRESWSINGIVDRSLITAYWKESGKNNYKDVLSRFLDRVFNDRNRIVNIRLNNEEVQMMDDLANEEGESRSDFLRRVLQQELEKKGKL